MGNIVTIDEQVFSDIADAIRNKNKTSETYKPGEMAAAIGDIKTGGGTIGSVYQDQDGYVVLDDEPGIDTIIEPLSVTVNGTYTAPTGTAYSPVTVNVSGGGGEPVSRKQINFIDYDGTLLHSYTKAEWQNVSALPSNPSHSGLTAQGWNWTKEQIDTQLTAIPDGDVWVGQMYITDDEKTRIYIHLEEGRLHPYLGICPNGTVIVDWGDGSETSTLTGTSTRTVQYADHTYASSGDYMITLTVSSGSFAFYGSSNTSYILKKDTSNTASVHRVYTNAVRKLELGSNVRIDQYAFNYCYSLASITIPSSVTYISKYAFYYCHSLASITIPNSVTSIETYTFYCSLASITIPSSVTSIEETVFYNCYSLVNVAIPSGMTRINNGIFQNCYSLASITIPSSVTSIGSNAFGSCTGMAEYHILPTTPPTLENTNAFIYIPSDCVIYVPYSEDHSILETYKTATNWSTYASYMQEESQ